jgi:hypothetical protein
MRDDEEEGGLEFTTASAGSMQAMYRQNTFPAHLTNTSMV